MELQDQYFVGYFWAPYDQQTLIFDQLKEFSAVKIGRHDEPHKIAPPTFIRTNAFTDIFQYMINTYGVPRYTEANPALLTIVTFPFLFGMMYGDIGHGSLWFLMGIIFVLLGDRLPPMAAWVRYLILLMGFCSFYCGWVYNEWFGIPINVFGACYNINDPVSLLAGLQPMPQSNVLTPKLT